MNTPDVTRLPKWAQDHIRNLERARENAVRLLDKFTKTETPTRLYYDEHAFLGRTTGPEFVRHYLPDGETFVFTPKGDVVSREDTIDVRFAQRSDAGHDLPNGGLIVSGRCLCVKPVVSNQVTIELGKYSWDKR